jgi:membrane-bound ClpP family serine protease
MVDLSFWMLGCLFSIFIVLFVFERDYFANYIFLILAGICLTFFILNQQLQPIGYIGFMIVILGSVFFVVDFVKNILMGVAR